MKDRIEWTLFFILVTISCVLLLVMIWLNIFYRSAARVYSISVIIREPSERFTKGMEQAALDSNADLQIQSSFEPNNTEQQIEYLRRELINYSDAVIINAEDPKFLKEYLDRERPSVPIVTVMQPLDSASVVCHVGADESELGRILGEWIAKSASGQCVVIAPKKDVKQMHITRFEALKQVLDSAGKEFAVRYADADSIADELSGERYDTIAVIDENLLVNTCEQVRSGAGIYGIGYTGGLRPYLESGRIKGLAVYSEYDAGYLSVQAAVEAAAKKTVVGTALTIHRVTAKNMYQEPMVNVLFPIG